MNRLEVKQVSPQTNNVSKTDSVSQTKVINVPERATSPQQSLVPHRNIVSRGTKVPEAKTVKVLNKLRGQITSVSQETNEVMAFQQSHPTAGACNKGLVDPQSACELSVQSATSSEGSADYMQKDELTNTGSQLVPERQSVATNEKLIPSQKTTCNPQPVSLHNYITNGFPRHIWVPFTNFCLLFEILSNLSTRALNCSHFFQTPVSTSMNYEINALYMFICWIFFLLKFLVSELRVVIIIRLLLLFKHILLLTCLVIKSKIAIVKIAE